MGVLDDLKAHRVIPVVVLHKPENANALGDALVAGELPVAEISLVTDGALRIVGDLAARGDMLVGATVLTGQEVTKAVGAGAQFVASQGLSEDVLTRSVEVGVPYLPGVATASEIQRALSLGLRSLRFFPAGTLGGVAGVKLLSKSFPQVEFIPTGGVGAAHIRDYLRLRSVPAVAGSWMVPGQALGRGDFTEVRDRTAHAVRLARTA